jgi:transposase
MAEQKPTPICLDLLRDAPRETLLQVIELLLAKTARLEKRVEEVEAKLNANSNNSSRPPSSDPPFAKPPKKDKGRKGKAGAKKGHKGARQQMLEPTERKELFPERCSCGSREFRNHEPYYTHQRIELPEVAPEVTHFILYRGKCSCCGKVSRALVPPENRTGYGPRLSAVIAELAGNHGDSRGTIQHFCASVLGFSLSLGAIQKILDRASEAIAPHYEAIGNQARQAAVNHVDETSWRLKGALCWLWVLANSSVSFFMIHSKRSKGAFKDLVKEWEGILVSDGYGVYTDWVNLRQTCLAHLIRDARALSESKNRELAKFGGTALKELQRLCHMAHAPPTIGEWRAFYARFIRLTTRYHGRKDEAGKFTARLLREIDSLWVFLEKAGVSPTNNHAERMLRFAVCWRKRSYGTVSDKGNRWVERILSLRQTCRLQSRRTFPVLVEAIDCYFKERKPDLTWISQP